MADTGYIKEAFFAGQAFVGHNTKTFADNAPRLITSITDVRVRDYVIGQIMQADPEQWYAIGDYVQALNDYMVDERRRHVEQHEGCDCPVPSEHTLAAVTLDAISAAMVWVQFSRLEDETRRDLGAILGMLYLTTNLEVLPDHSLSKLLFAMMTRGGEFAAEWVQGIDEMPPWVMLRITEGEYQEHLDAFNQRSTVAVGAS